jgi:CMP-N,N'-diacetyllegionaminic acid synthase
MNNLLITICARGGSKGIPNKNSSIINRIPLIAYTINIASKFANLQGGHVALSTDSDEIKKIAKAYGLRTDYIRPADLSADNTGKIDTIRDLLLFEEKKNRKIYDFVLDLDVTSPLRTMSDLSGAYDLITADENALNIFSVSKPHRNPYFNVVEKDKDGYFKLVKTPEKPIKSRQTAPRVFDLNASYYFYRRRFFEMGFENAYTPRSLVSIVEHICFDLDEPVDFLFMEYLIVNNKLDFDFIESCI